MEQTFAPTILLLKSIATTHKLTFWKVPDGRFLAMAALFGSDLLLFRFVFIFRSEFAEHFFCHRRRCQLLCWCCVLFGSSTLSHKFFGTEKKGRKKTQIVMSMVSSDVGRFMHLFCITFYRQSLSICALFGQSTSSLKTFRHLITRSYAFSNVHTRKKKQSFLGHFSLH